MQWLNIELKTLRSPQYLGSNPSKRATWINVLAYCCDQENGGRLAGAAAWSDREWQQLCGVTRREVAAADKLLLVEGNDIVVWAYPAEKQEEVQAKRAAGRAGGIASGRSRASSSASTTASSTASGSASGTASSTPSSKASSTAASRASSSARTERKGRELISPLGVYPPLPATTPDTPQKTGRHKTSPPEPPAAKTPGTPEPPSPPNGNTPPDSPPAEQPGTPEPSPNREPPPDPALEFMHNRVPRWRGEHIDSPELEEAWKAWMMHHAEKRRPLTSYQVARHVEILQRLSVTDAIRAIENAISRNQPEPCLPFERPPPGRTADGFAIGQKHFQDDPLVIVTANRRYENENP